MATTRSKLVYRGDCIENSATAVLGRITDMSGEAIQAEDIESIVLRVFYHTAGETAERGDLVVPEGENALTYTGTVLDVGDIVLDAPEINDVRWPFGVAGEEASTGYNLFIPLDGSYVPEGGVTYRVQAYVTPADTEYVIGLPYYLIWDLTAENIYEVGD